MFCFVYKIILEVLGVRHFFERCYFGGSSVHTFLDLIMVGFVMSGLLLNSIVKKLRDCFWMDLCLYLWWQVSIECLPPGVWHWRNSWLQKWALIDSYTIMRDLVWSRESMDSRKRHRGLYRHWTKALSITAGKKDWSHYRMTLTLSRIKSLLRVNEVARLVHYWYFTMCSF